MSSLLTDAEWDDFKGTIFEAHETFNNDILTWRRRLYFIDPYNEDPNTAGWDDIPLNVYLIGNYFRSWPITELQPYGDIDKESMGVLINRQYLENSGYINSYGKFNFSPGDDRFLWNGITHKCMGWVDVSQAKDEMLMVMLILVREEEYTGGTVEATPPVSIIGGITDISDRAASLFDFSLSTDYLDIALPIAANIWEKVSVVNTDGDVIASYTIKRSNGDLVSGTIPAEFSHDETTAQLFINFDAIDASATFILYFTVIQDGVAGNTVQMYIPTSSGGLLEFGGQVS